MDVMSGPQTLSINARASVLVERLKQDAAELRIAVTQGPLGETLIDAGRARAGSIAAGLRIAEICMAGLGRVELLADAQTPRWPWTVTVASSSPVLACLASQYAGWRLSDETGGTGFVALGSGPARALARKEALFEQLGYRDVAEQGTLVLESSRPPPPAIIEKVARDCGLEPSRLTVIYAPTQSLAGSTQVVARVLEVALHKAHELKYPLDRILEGMAAAPLAPPHPDFVTAMGRTNDAIIHGGRVHLFVSGPGADAETLARDLPSSASRDYGRPFADVFRGFKGDFYAIDPMLFSPAQVIVTAVDTGQSFHQGRLDLTLLDASFA